MYMPEITYVEAIRSALREEMRRDERVFIIGEDIGRYGGAFGVTTGMLDEFGDKRIIETPISEPSIIGAAVGGGSSGHAADCRNHVYGFHSANA
jgi:pyruvate dehydrogenase E1 component beta subunit